MSDFQKYLALLVAIAAIFSGLLSPVLGFDLAFGTPEGGGDNGDGTGEDGTGEDGTDTQLELEPDPCVEDPTLESGYTEAIDFVKSVCSIRTRALVDEDDGQKEGSFDRLIGLVYCGDSGINNKESLNELLLEGGFAVIDQDFCNISEFPSASWAQRYGC